MARKTPICWNLWWQPPCEGVDSKQVSFTSRTQFLSSRTAQLSGVIASFRCPCSMWPSAPSHPQCTKCTHWRSIFQQISVQIHEWFIDVARYGTQRSPVWTQQHWYSLLPVAEWDTGALKKGKPRWIRTKKKKKNPTAKRYPSYSYNKL